jgi:hypothetical protein
MEHVAAKTLALNEIGICNLELDSQIAYTPYAENRNLGSFIIIDRFMSSEPPMPFPICACGMSVDEDTGGAVCACAAETRQKAVTGARHSARMALRVSRFMSYSFHVSCRTFGIFILTTLALFDCSLSNMAVKES